MSTAPTFLEQRKASRYQLSHTTNTVSFVGSFKSQMRCSPVAVDWSLALKEFWLPVSHIIRTLHVFEGQSGMATIACAFKEQVCQRRSRRRQLLGDYNVGLQDQEWSQNLNQKDQGLTPLPLQVKTLFLYSVLYYTNSSLVLACLSLRLRPSVEVMNISCLHQNRVIIEVSAFSFSFTLIPCGRGLVATSFFS